MRNNGALQRKIHPNNERRKKIRKEYNKTLKSYSIDTMSGSAFDKHQQGGNARMMRGHCVHNGANFARVQIVLLLEGT
jgi:hypothetical protein